MARLIAERPTIAFMPAISHLAGEGDVGRLRSTLLRLLRLTIWVVGLLMAGFFALNHDFLRLWVGSDFFAGQLVNGLFALGMGLAVLVSTCANLGFAIGDVRGNSVAILVMSLLTIGLLWLGGRFGGLAGIAAAPLIGSLLVGATYFPAALARQLHAEPADWRALRRDGLLTIGLTVSCAIVASRMEPQSWPAFAASLAGCVGFFVVGIGVLSPAGRDEIAAVVRRLGLARQRFF